jgi:hypothetical protein
MSEVKGVRWVWLRVMYIWSIVIAGIFGLGMIFAPNAMQSTFDELCDPVIYGIAGSMFLAVALISILGLRAPLKFVPVLFFELVYKVIWFVGVALPLVIAGEFSADDILTVAIFALTIIGDAIAIPFSHLFARQPTQ